VYSLKYSKLLIIWANDGEKMHNGNAVADTYLFVQKFLVWNKMPVVALLPYLFVYCFL
jgi:hypothetical protein